MITQVIVSRTTGLMLSGGLDSAILLVHLLEQGCRVQPFYVKAGCRWEAEERRAVGQLLKHVDDSAVAPLVELEMPVGELYGSHWSVTGHRVPDACSTDEAVELLGRNPLLLLKAMLWCGQHQIAELALATLACNPFADATDRFFGQFAQALETATGSRVRIICPFATKSKAEVLELTDGVGLHHTFSCLAPQGGLHCGACNKCAERGRALQTLAGGDPTVYASGRPSFHLATEKDLSNVSSHA